MAYHALRHILYVGGQTTAIRKIDLATRSVTTIRLNTEVVWPFVVRLTPTGDALFVAAYRNHIILAIDTATETLIRVVAGASDAPGTSDGFGGNARFTNPQGIALVGLEYSWPCLYVCEERNGYVREIRLRDQYVHTITLVGLPVGVDIENIVSYTNRTTGEFGLLLMNLRNGSHIFFLPIGIAASTSSASNEWSSSQLSSSASVSTTEILCRCASEAVQVSLSAPVGLCVACQARDTIVVLSGNLNVAHLM